ncbi:MAG: LysR family transcriptional regulator, partial [Alphaproteobacteria bacterium]
IWAARLGSFTRAAGQVGATQAGVSARIAALEAELGQKLFSRERHGLTLTPAGLSALRRAEELLEAARRLREEMRGEAGMRGTVRIGAIDTLTHTWFVDLIRAARRMFPHLSVEMTADTSQRLAQLLRAGEIDLALIMGPVPDPGLVSIELCTYACHWVAAPALGLHEGRVTLERLARHPVISFPRGSQPHAAIDRFFRQYADGEVILYAANSLASIIRFAVDGLGVATIPPVVAPRELARGELILLDAPQPIPPMRFHAVYPEAACSKVPALMAELARKVALDFCRRTDPGLAWDRMLMREQGG